eukprot:486350-Amphidinium_carterae.1
MEDDRKVGDMQLQNVSNAIHSETIALIHVYKTSCAQQTRKGGILLCKGQSSSMVSNRFASSQATKQTSNT